MSRLLLGALTAALLSAACGTPDPAAPAPELGRTQASLSTLATYDSTRRVPRCASVGTGCDSGTLLRGRASLGPESNTPNTLGGTCPDGTSGTYRSDESLEQLEVATVDGTSLAAGKQVRIRATVWAWSGYTSDKLDLYTAPNADSPVWTFLTTLTPTQAGSHVLTATYTLPAGALQAVRGIFRYSGTAASCGRDSYTDNDDLVFAVQSGPVAPAVSLTAPAANAVLQNLANLTAEYSGPTAPARVSFYEGTRWLGDAVSAPYRYSWDTRAVANGTYGLSARALDSAGSTLATSATVYVQVRNDLAAPTVRLTAPVAGAVVRGSVFVAAEASDDIGVTRVDFYRGTQLLAALTSSPYSFSWNTRNEANGTYSLTARAYDAAGKSTTSTAVSVTVDNDSTPPTASITRPTAGQLTSGSVSLAASASDDRGLARLEFFVDSLRICDMTLMGELAVDRTCAWNGATGTHSLHVQATDQGGNVRVTAAVSFTVDASPPTVSITSPAPNVRVSSTVQVLVSMTDNRGFSRTELYVGGTLVATQSTSPFNLTWDASSMAPGTYVMQVRAYDTVGNMGASPTQQVTVFRDTTPPVVTIDSPSSDGYARGVLQLSALAQDDAGVKTLELLLDGVYVHGQTYSGPGSPYASVWIDWDSTQVSEGAHTLVARAYDTAGNVAVSMARTITVDRTPPQVSITSPANGAEVLGWNVQVQVAASDASPLWHVQLVVDGTVVSAQPSSPGVYTWNAFEAAEGPHVIMARTMDAAFNVAESAPVEVVLNKGPAPTVELVHPGGTVQDTVQLEALASVDGDIAWVEFWLGTERLGEVAAPPYVLAWDSFSVPDGAYELRAVAVSVTGKQGTSAPVAITVANDHEAPFIALRLYDSDNQLVTGNEVQGVMRVSGDAHDGSSVALLELYIDGQRVETGPPGPATQLDYTWDTGLLPDGTHTLELRAEDTAGYAASVTRTVTVANDQMAPHAFMSLTDIHGQPVTGNEVNDIVHVRGEAFDDTGVAQLELYLDGQLVASGMANPEDPVSSLLFTWDTSSAPDGAHTLELRATDPYGKMSTVTRPLVVTNDWNPPDVFLLSPSESASLSNQTLVRVDAIDDTTVARIDLLVDGVPLASSLSVPGEFIWDTRWHASGSHTVTARAWDVTGKMGESQTRTVYVSNYGVTGQAAHDASLQAPGCATVESSCDSGVLLVGSGPDGFEPHAPNTLASSTCEDAAPAGFHAASNIDRLWVSSTSGGPMAAGDWVAVQLKVWTTSPLDLIELYSAGDAANPTWTRVATLTPSASGPVQLDASFQLPAGTLQAVRAVLRRGGTSSACVGGSVADHDDLFFAVQ